MYHWQGDHFLSIQIISNYIYVSVEPRVESTLWELIANAQIDKSRAVQTCKNLKAQHGQMNRPRHL